MSGFLCYNITTLFNLAKGDCMKTFIEYDDAKPCPCGSQKTYNTCCKLKSIRWGFDESGALVKQPPMSLETEEKLKATDHLFEQYYGRKPDKEDYVFSFTPIYQDELLFKVMKALRLSGIPPEDIYAYYKTDGLLASSVNDQFISEKDKKDYMNYRDEYCKAINEPLADAINTIQLTAYGNELLISTFDKVQERLIGSLNDFIHRHSNKPNGIYNYEMQSEVDYLLFSAIKTIKTMKGIALLIDEQIPECIHALGRSLFENYMYLNKINCDPSFFKMKLLPKVDKVHFQFVTKKDKTIDHNKVFHIETGDIYNIHVIIAELKKSFKNPEDQVLYDLYYCNSCQYVHVDVLSATNYFSTYDPYDELNPSLQAAISTASISILLYNALIHNRLVSSRFYQDGSYLIRQLTKDLLAAIELVNCDPKHKQPIFSTLLKRLQTLYSELSDSTLEEITGI